MPDVMTQDAELKIQADCFMWFHNNYPAERKMLFHVQNKAKNAIEGAKFKTLGVVTGVSDFVLILPEGKVAWIEMKDNKGKQSSEQVAFEAKLLIRGHNYYIVRSFEEFKSLVIKLLKLN